LLGLTIANESQESQTVLQEYLSFLENTLNFSNQNIAKAATYLSKEGNLRKTEKPQFGNHSPAAHGGADQFYDFYVLSLSWGPSYCIKSSKFDECMANLRRLNLNNKLTIHGLWPSRKDKTMLGDCNTGAPIKITPTAGDPFSTMTKQWFTMKRDNTNEDFWGHEYNKHGVCYSTTTKQPGYAAFFSKVLDVFAEGKLSDLMIKTVDVVPGKSVAMPVSSWMEKFSQVLGSNNFELDCIKKDSVQYLYELRVYYDLDFTKLNGYRCNDSCNHNQDVTVSFE